jgi:hypothetical protein
MGVTVSAHLPSQSTKLSVAKLRRPAKGGSFCGSGRHRPRSRRHLPHSPKHGEPRVSRMSESGRLPVGSAGFSQPWFLILGPRNPGTSVIGTKRTSAPRRKVSASDPKRTCALATMRPKAARSDHSATSHRLSRLNVCAIVMTDIIARPNIRDNLNSFA